MADKLIAADALRAYYHTDGSDILTLAAQGKVPKGTTDIRFTQVIWMGGLKFELHAWVPVGPATEEYRAVQRFVIHNIHQAAPTNNVLIMTQNYPRGTPVTINFIPGAGPKASLSHDDIRALLAYAKGDKEHSAHDSSDDGTVVATAAAAAAAARVIVPRVETVNFTAHLGQKFDIREPLGLGHSAATAASHTPYIDLRFQHTALTLVGSGVRGPDLVWTLRPVVVGTTQAVVIHVFDPSSYVVRKVYNIDVLPSRANLAAFVAQAHALAAGDGNSSNDAVVAATCCSARASELVHEDEEKAIVTFEAADAKDARDNDDGADEAKTAALAAPAAAFAGNTLAANNALAAFGGGGHRAGFPPMAFLPALRTGLEKVRRDCKAPDAVLAVCDATSPSGIPVCDVRQLQQLACVFGSQQHTKGAALACQTWGVWGTPFCEHPSVAEPGFDVYDARLMDIVAAQRKWRPQPGETFWKVRLARLFIKPQSSAAGGDGGFTDAPWYDFELRDHHSHVFVNGWTGEVIKTGSAPRLLVLPNGADDDKAGDE